MLKICTEELCRFQAGRRSNVTGGGGGTEKILGGIQIKFSLKFWSEDQKKSSFQIAPSGYGPFASFRGTIMAWRGATGPYGTELGFCPQIQDEDQKSLRCEIFGFVLAFTCVFRPETRLYSHLGGTCSILGGHRRRNGNALQGHQACYILLGHNPHLGAQFSLGGLKQ